MSEIDEYYVEDRPVLLRHTAGRQGSAWDDLIFTIRRVGPYSLLALVVGSAFTVLGHSSALKWLSTAAQHLGTGAVMCSVALFAYEYRRGSRVTDVVDAAPADPHTTHKITRRNRLIDTWRHVGAYCGAGVAIALILWLLVPSLATEEHTADVLNHIAGAFFVAAIVIFGYEWGSETKRAAGLAVSLVYAVRSMMDRIETHVSRLLNVSSRNALANAVSDLVGPDSKELSSQLETFANALHQLGTRRDWASTGYLTFVWKYHEMLSDNVRKLAAFATGPHSDEFAMHFPRAQTIADAMVTGTMQELARLGGGYYALSDCATWQQLTNFRESQKSDQHKNVKVQRIFVLGREADDDLPLGKIAEIMLNHYDDATSSNGIYELRVTDVTEDILVKLPSLNQAQHLGIFRPNGHKAIVFSVHDKNMSEFRLRLATENMFSEFGAVWDELSRDQHDSTDPKTLERNVRDYLLAYSMRRMRMRSSYRGVSRISTWQGDAFRRFIDATEKAINQREVVVCRLLVFDPGDISNPDAVALLKRHQDLANRTSSRYQWRVCQMAEWSPEVAKDIAFGVFGDENTMMGDVSTEIRPFVKTIDRFNYNQLYTAFEKVWASAESTRDSIKKVFGDQADATLSALGIQ